MTCWLLSVPRSMKRYEQSPSVFQGKAITVVESKSERSRMSLKAFKAWNLKRLHARVADIDVLIKISIMDIFPVTYRPAVVFAFLHQVDLIRRKIFSEPVAPVICGVYPVCYRMKYKTDSVPQAFCENSAFLSIKIAFRDGSPSFILFIADVARRTCAQVYTSIMYLYRPCKMTSCWQIIYEDFQSILISLQSLFLYLDHPVFLCNIEPAFVEISPMRSVEIINKGDHFIRFFIIVPVWKRDHTSSVWYGHKKNPIPEQHHPRTWIRTRI